MNFDELANRYLDGQATANEVDELDHLLLNDPDTRRAFTDLANQDAALMAQAADWQQPVHKEEPKRVRFRTRTVLALAACLTLGFATWWSLSSTPVSATVVHGIGIVELQPGMKVRQESYHIQTGTVEFITARGAHVVIEAPATFHFESSQKLHLLLGRIAADVPPTAKGFTVITPNGKAVDLGTKFGVDVPAHGTSEIHVFEGEVIAQSAANGKRQSLRDGEAFALQAGINREIRSAAFIRPGETASLSAGLAAGQRARAETSLAKLRQDPSLITLLDFEANAPPSGRYQMVQGRWPGSKAPEFVHVGDHMKLNVGAGRSWPQLTLSAWVRLDRLGATYQSLYHTDGWDDDKSGQVHWIINPDTTMRLALKHNTLAPGSDEKQGFPDSRSPVLPEQGRWVHLSVVYNAPAKTVRFYLNGRFDKETKQSIAHPALLGPAQIGNWNAKDRTLSGRVDELILLGRTMTDSEIYALYEAGNPYH